MNAIVAAGEAAIAFPRPSDWIGVMPRIESAYKLERMLRRIDKHHYVRSSALMRKRGRSRKSVRLFECEWLK